MLSRNLFATFLGPLLLAALTGCDTRPKIVMPTGPVPPPPRPAAAGGTPAQQTTPPVEQDIEKHDVKKPTTASDVSSDKR